ncbi:MAG: tRNA (adenosine(37)-N6)-threonylcarbamoyltransferase complex dimerization subunit type 1 TsaB [Patulibacter minatonensis]
MNLLAFDTSSAGTLVVAQRSDGAIAERRHAPSGGERPAHTTLGFPLAAEALADLGLRWDDLARIGVGTGPGSFTGLRAGISAAAGLARRLDVPLIGSTATAILAAGAQAAAEQRTVLAVVDGRRREVFVERWAAGEGAGIQVFRRPELADTLGTVDGWLAIGDGALLEREALLGLGADVPEPGDPLHQLGGAALAALTAAGAPTSADDVRPTYGRAADAVPTAQRDGATS